MASIRINGVEYSGNNLVINDGVFVDGKKITSDEKTINIIVDGNINKVEVASCDKILVNGNVDEIDNTSGDIYVNEIRGNVSTTSGDVNCEGNVGGSINTTSGNVKANDVNGSIKTMSGNIKHNQKTLDTTTTSTFFTIAPNRIFK